MISLEPTGKEAIERRRKQVHEAYLAGRSLQSLADLWGVRVTTIKSDLQVMLAKTSLEDSELEFLRETAYQRYERILETANDTLAKAKTDLAENVTQVIAKTLAANLTEWASEEEVRKLAGKVFDAISGFLPTADPWTISKMGDLIGKTISAQVKLTGIAKDARLLGGGDAEGVLIEEYDYRKTLPPASEGSIEETETQDEEDESRTMADILGDGYDAELDEA